MTHRLRRGWCRSCDRLCTFRAAEVVRCGMVYPVLECRTCGKRRIDGKKKPHVKLTQGVLFH